MPPFSRIFSITPSILLFGLSIACTRPDSKAAGTTPVDSTQRPATVATDSAFRNAAVSWSAEKLYDLTGSESLERLSVRAYGPTYDSLLVVLEIYGSDNTLLYRDRWTSDRYFAYDYRKGKPDTTVQRIVLGHLNRLLSDSAFIPALSANNPRTLIDTMTVRYDLAEREVREQNQLQDTSTLSTAMLDAVENVAVPKDEINKIINETKGRSRFTYFAGGELTYTLAWSPTLRRMVRVFSCC